MKLIKNRRLLILLFFLALPITINYFSPVLVVLGGFEGVVAGSFFIWSLMFISSLFIGRAWCAYICPYGGLQMISDKAISRKLMNIKYLRIIKHFIGVLWICLIIYAVFSVGGFKKVEFLYNTENIVSTDSVSALIRYYMICGGIFLIALIFGKRGACHYICPMASINILGTKIKNLLRVPSLHLKVNSENCKSCKLCNQVCPMSLDVSRMVKGKNMNNTECILCGECSKTCKNGCIEYGFGRVRIKKK